MKFDDAVATITRTQDLRRIASAHVIDHRQLSNEDLREALIKVKPQYTHEETIQVNLEKAFFKEESLRLRVLCRLLLVDVLLDQYDFQSPWEQTNTMVMAREQAIVNKSNEITLEDLGCADRNSTRYKNLELYSFVLRVAWDHNDTKSPDEVNLLRKLRDRLGITESDHRLIEAKLGMYPQPDNAIHNREEINDARRFLQGLGLLFAVRDESNVDIDLIPEEIAVVLRRILGLELREDSYRSLMNYRLLRRKAILTDVLSKVGVEFSRYDTVEALVDRIISYVPPSKAIASASPRYGLNKEQLSAWCKELNQNTSGNIDDLNRRIILHFDQLRPRIEGDKVDERAHWYIFYEDLARRDYDALRSQQIIEKDLEIESKFEDATEYLFAEKLNHSPLHQLGNNIPDGLLSLGTNYVMWDNKSKESAVNLRDHIRQFDGYMEKADKPVPIFLVIAPSFTDASESEAIHYHAEHFGRNIVLITASELKQLAEEWASGENRRRDEPFPLGLLATTGRFERSRLGQLT